MTGGARLVGRVRVTGAKNSALKLMAAALLTPGRTTIDEVPDILDVSIMSDVLRRLGCEVSYERTPDGGGGGRISMTVLPLASTAAIRRFSVAPTLGKSSQMDAPASRPARAIR